MRRLIAFTLLISTASLLCGFQQGKILAPILQGAPAASATPVFIQAADNCNFFGTSATTITVGGTTSACTGGAGWGSNVTAGSLLAGFVLRKVGGGTLSSVADGGDTCVAVNSAGLPSTGVAGTGNGYLLYGFYCQNVTGGSKPTITLTFTVTENVAYIFAHEVSGIAAATPLEASIGVGMGVTGGGTNAGTTGNFTTATNGDYVMGVYYDDGGGAPTITAGTTSQAWTKRLTTDQTGSEAMTSEDGVQTTASASTVIAFTTNAGSNPVVGAMGFKHQ